MMRGVETHPNLSPRPPQRWREREKVGGGAAQSVAVEEEGKQGTAGGTATAISNRYNYKKFQQKKKRTTNFCVWPFQPIPQFKID